jgi:hypothetical protein
MGTVDGLVCFWYSWLDILFLVGCCRVLSLMLRTLDPHVLQKLMTGFKWVRTQK